MQEDEYCCDHDREIHLVCLYVRTYESREFSDTTKIFSKKEQYGMLEGEPEFTTKRPLPGVK